VRRAGRTWGSNLLVLNAARNGSDVVRCGFIAGKKVGNAVKRNRARRLMKEAVRHRLHTVKPGWDLVWIARAPIVEADFGAVGQCVDDILHRSRLRAIAETETAAPQSRIIRRDEVAAPQGDERAGTVEPHIVPD
ncbi:MAG: ribonuclease P protein component, partial [Chloroflexota bacterium]|nr:ribonuclease P protein component [Chloroflexota bacterium]